MSDETDMAEQTSIRIKSNTRDHLRALKEGGETYDDVINRIIDELDVLKYETGEH